MNTTTLLDFESLSNREVQVIRLLIEGKNRQQISDQLAISIHTYDGYRKNIREKLRIKNQLDWAKVLTAFDR